MKPGITRITSGIVLCFVLGQAAQAREHECRASAVAGRYGYTSSGTIVTPAVGPFTAVGEVTLTRTGTFTGSQTTSIAGTLFAETVSGIFTVNPDCTGVMTAYVYHGSTLARTTQLNWVWDNNEREARAIFLAPGTVITITARKMFNDE